MPVNEEIVKSALISILMVVAVIAGRSTLPSVHFRSHPDLDIGDRHRSLIFSRNITMLLVLLGLAMI